MSEETQSVVEIVLIRDMILEEEKKEKIDLAHLFTLTNLHVISHARHKTSTDLFFDFPKDITIHYVPKIIISKKRRINTSNEIKKYNLLSPFRVINLSGIRIQFRQKTHEIIKKIAGFQSAGKKTSYSFRLHFLRMSLLFFGIILIIGNCILVVIAFFQKIF